MDKNVFIAASHTGGHVFPAVVVASALQKKGVQVHWLGTAVGQENKLVPKDIPLHPIAMCRTRGQRGCKFLVSLLRLLGALLQSLRLMLGIRGKVVILFGGFICVPVGLAAWLLRKKIIVHEQNAIPGRANRLLRIFADQIFESFPGTFPVSGKVQTSGNPVRPEILALPTPQQRFKKRNLQNQPLRILVLGGSQGASFLNETVPEALSKISVVPKLKPWHLCGDRHVTQTTKLYKRLAIPVRIDPFLHDMDKAYGWADIVIARAGATTLSELAAVGIASILVPYPHATSDHQTKNAHVFVQKKAAFLLPQTVCTPHKLAQVLKHYIQNPHLLYDMALAARALAVPGATYTITEACL